MRIVIIGAGNVATHLAHAFRKNGHTLCGVWSRTQRAAQTLADSAECSALNDLSKLPVADIYIIAVKDNCIEGVAEKISRYKCPEAVVVHTAGSIPMDILSPYAPHYGVIYPMQTFSKSHAVDFKDIPVFIESSDAMAQRVIEQATNSLSEKVMKLDSNARRYLHLSAVFACNFVNHCYSLAEELVRSHGIYFDMLLPLIDETARKVHSLSPTSAQTGPAMRGDMNVLDAQKKLLENMPNALCVYQTLSQSIISHQEKRERPDIKETSNGKDMINYDLKKIKAMAFDVDGVLSANSVFLLDDSGQPCRTANIKDGYALQLAVKGGLQMAIITGGRNEAVRERYKGLGFQDVFMGVSVKIEKFREWMTDYGLQPEEVLYMGDDIPDYEVMKECGCPCCPSDAAAEIKEIAIYISQNKGGDGCVRDVVEQVLKAKGIWMSSAEAFGW